MFVFKNYKKKNLKQNQEQIKEIYTLGIFVHNDKCISSK